MARQNDSGSNSSDNAPDGSLADARAEAKDILDEDLGGLSLEDDDEDEGGDDVVDDAEGDADALDGDDEGEGDEGEPGDDDEDDDDDAPADRDAPEGVDRGDGRDAKGKFATKAERDAANAKASADAAAATTTAAVEQPKFEPLVIKADKVDVPIDEAQIVKANGHHLFAVKDADAPRFIQRLTRGVVAEKVWRELQAEQQKVATKLQELEDERSGPSPKSDAEIEAEMTLAVLKPHLAEILTPEQVEALEAKVQLAQMQHRTEFPTKRTEHLEQLRKERETKQTAEQQERETREAPYHGLARELIEVATQVPELRGLNERDLKAAYTELAKTVRRYVWQEADGLYSDRDALAAHLRAVVARKSGTGAPSGNGATATADATRPAADGADRFNAGQNSAGEPRKTTSLKSRRGQGARSRDERNTRSNQGTERNGGRVTSPEADAENAWRKKTRSFMNSNSLDFDDDDEG